MKKITPIRIAVVGQFEVWDYDFNLALRAVSQDPTSDEAKFFDCTRFYSLFPNMAVSFSQRPLFFLRNNNIEAEMLREHVLSKTQGVIVNLSGLALKPDYLANSTTIKFILESYLQVVYETKQPTIFAVEDIKGIPIKIPKSIDISGMAGRQLSRFLKEREYEYFTLEDDIWQPASPTMQAIRRILKVPETIPFFPYRQDRPESNETILKTLLAQIETD